MTEPADFNPPPPRRAYPAPQPALAVGPLPAQASPAWGGGGQLQYARPLEIPRPGLLTTVAVLAICFGTLGLLTNCISGFYVGAASWVVANWSKMMATATAAGMNNGVSDADAQVIEQQLVGSTPLSEERRSLLARFLAEQGGSIFSVANGQVTAGYAPLGAVSHRQGPTTQPTGRAIDLFQAGPGEMQVCDDFVAWYPGRSARGGLNSTELQQAIAAIDQLAGGMTPEQRQVVVRELSRADQKLLRPVVTGRIEMQISGALHQEEGALVVHAITGGVLYVRGEGPADGKDADAVPVHTTTVIVGSPNAGGSGVATRPATAPSTLPALANLGQQISKGALALGLAESLGSLAASVFLIVLGIGTFSRWRRGRRMYIGYAWAKLLLTATYLLALGWLIQSVSDMISGIDPGAAWQVMSSTAYWLVGMGVVSAAFPIFVLIAMRTRSVRAYYDALGEQGALGRAAGGAGLRA